MAGSRSAKLSSLLKAVTSMRGRMICRTSMLPNLTMPRRIRCSSAVVLASLVRSSAWPKASTEMFCVRFL